MGKGAISEDGKYKAEGMASAKAVRLKHAWCVYRSAGRPVTKGSNELGVRGTRARRTLTLAFSPNEMGTMEGSMQRGM